MSVSASQIVAAAKSNQTVGSFPSAYITAVFDLAPSWLYAHYIPALRFELCDTLRCRLDICSGGSGCFWVAFGFYDVPIHDWPRINTAFSSNAPLYLLDRYGLRSLSLKPAGSGRISCQIQRDLPLMKTAT